MMNPDDVSLLRLPIEDRASLSSTTTVCGELPAMMFLIVAASVMGMISVGYLLLKDKPCGDARSFADAHARGIWKSDTSGFEPRLRGTLEILSNTTELFSTMETRHLS